MKDNRGQITIMMIVTVIVFIILGGICIFMLTGENGLFVPRRDFEEIENNNTVNQNEIQEENITNSEKNAITVPMQ